MIEVTNYYEISEDTAKSVTNLSSCGCVCVCDCYCESQTGDSASGFGDLPFSSVFDL